MPGIDAHVWLVWLSRDENADVRLAALTVMATTSDPNVLRRIDRWPAAMPISASSGRASGCSVCGEAGNRPNGGRRSTR